MQRWVPFYESERQEGEPFRAFAHRVGAPQFEDRVKDLTMPIEFNLENMSHFIDWDREGQSAVQRGEGECGA